FIRYGACSKPPAPPIAYTDLPVAVQTTVQNPHACLPARQLRWGELFDSGSSPMRGGTGTALEERDVEQSRETLRLDRPGAEPLSCGGQLGVSVPSEESLPLRCQA